jgi:peptide/nickel transport system permease protein
MSAQLQTLAPPLAQPQRTTRRSIARRIRRSHATRLGLAMTLALVLLAVGAPLVATADPNALDSSEILVAPSSAHLFGTDDFGRDLFSRVLYGARISILVGITVALTTTLTGLLFGTLSGYYPRLDNPIMRMMDILMAFPAILLAIAIMTVLGPQLLNVIIALIIPFTPRAARVVRGEILRLRQQEFVQAARALGLSDGRIILRHLVPNSLTPLLVQQTFVVAVAILAEASLNFLGVGVPPTVPTLGATLADSRQFLRDAPWMSLFPGLFISLLVVGVNLLGDGLRDVLDPRVRL